MSKGQTQYLTAPVPAQPLRFSISLDDSGGGFGGDDLGTSYPPTPTNNIRRSFSRDDTEDSDNRLVRMLASQARLRGLESADGEDAIVKDPELTETERRKVLQDLLAMAASNGETDRLKRLLTGPTKEFVDVNAPDADGNVPIIYASCFGHLECVRALADAGADIDKRDYGSWCSLMWAITNRHKEIAKLLMDRGASIEVRTSSGRTPLDFVVPNSEMGRFLTQAGYKIGPAASPGEVNGGDDFYSAGTGFAQGRFEEEMAENEMRRRMMMESAINLEVDLGNLTLEEQSEACHFTAKSIRLY
jgi:hypothetical protein